jgi:hypothetical protein
LKKRQDLSRNGSPQGFTVRFGRWLKEPGRPEGCRKSSYARSSEKSEPPRAFQAGTAAANVVIVIGGLNRCATGSLGKSLYLFSHSRRQYSLRNRSKAKRMSRKEFSVIAKEMSLTFCKQTITILLVHPSHVGSLILCFRGSHEVGLSEISLSCPREAAAWGLSRSF